ncbi:MAG: radical SAM protein [Alphaproteobacteria bacterium]
MNQPAAPVKLLDPAKFRDPDVTATGAARARVPLAALETLWFNTGTLCNIACHNCYIESSPRNDRLAYLSAAEVASYLDEIARARLGTEEIGFTGGEPFMNPDIVAMLEDSLARGFRVLVLTNAMRPMMRRTAQLLALKERHGRRLVVRVSVDHPSRAGHERLRGPGTWEPTIRGLRWLSGNGFAVHVAGRTCWSEPEPVLRAAYGRLFRELGVPVGHDDPVELVLFPEMDEHLDVPEITEACWGLLGKAPESVMCASSRMVVKRKGAERPVVVPCTLLPYERAFEMGASLAEARGAVRLNHPHCARFCVLGGGSCSRTA